MRSTLCHLLPDLAQHTILEFMGYKLRCGKYMQQLPKDLPIYHSILNRPEVEEIHYTLVDFENSEFLYKYDNEDGTFDICDEDGYDTYFIISLVMNSFKRKYWIENVMEICYAYSDRNTFKVDVNVYEYDFDGSRCMVGK